MGMQNLRTQWGFAQPAIAANAVPKDPNDPSYGEKLGRFTQEERVRARDEIRKRGVTPTLRLVLDFLVTEKAQEEMARNGGPYTRNSKS